MRTKLPPVAERTLPIRWTISYKRRVDVRLRGRIFVRLRFAMPLRNRARFIGLGPNHEAEANDMAEDDWAHMLAVFRAESSGRNANSS